MTAATAEPVSGQRGFASSLVHRQLDSYPETGARFFYLAIVVLATITLYYELYVGGSVSTLILTNLGMTFKFYVLTLAIGNLLGAFGSLFAGLTDRYGRANLVVFGLGFAAVFVEFILPQATNRYIFTLEGFIVGIVEGICLVATPALIRDFSPQVGRATAMGFWTTGPVLGSLIVAIVGSLTVPAIITSTRFWTHEYRICGWVGLAVFVIALLGLKELSPQLRDQLMVSLRDRALIEMRAKGLDIEKALQNHWRQLMRPDIIISSVAVSVMLLMYYALVGFLVIYATSTFGYTLNTANNLGYYAWSFNAGAVIMVGWLSDRFRVRKPFMVVGGIGAAVLIVLFLEQSKVGAHPKFSTIAILLAVMLFFMGVAYTPWMASFTETVEDRNPAAIAAGLAVWGWIIRVIIFASFIFLPIVIKSVTPIVNYGTAIQTDLNNYPPLQWAKTHPTIVALGQKYGALGAEAQKLGPEIAFAQKYPAVVADLQKYTPTTIPSKLLDTAIKDAGGGTKGLTVLTTLGAESATLLQIKAHQAQLLQMQPYSSELLALQNKVPANVSSFVATFGPQVQAALLTAPNQWRNWFWVCFGGVIFFVLSIPLLRGRWRPRDAKRDEQEHEAMVQAELAKLSGASY